jgi:hypothetical protein
MMTSFTGRCVVARLSHHARERDVAGTLFEARARRELDDSEGVREDYWPQVGGLSNYPQEMDK